MGPGSSRSSWYRPQSARPDFAPFEEGCGSFRGFVYSGDLRSELDAKRMTGSDALDLLDDMLAIRELEEMIVRLRSDSGSVRVIAIAVERGRIRERLCLMDRA